MDQHSANADALGGDGNPAQRIRKNIAAKTFPCVIAIDRQAPDHGDRNRFGRIAPYLAGSGPALDRSGRDTEIGDYPISPADDIGAGEAAFVLQGSVTQPVIQRWLAAVETRHVVFSGQGKGSRSAGPVA